MFACRTVGWTDHSSNCKVRADPLFLAILFHVLEREDTGRDKVTRLIVVQFL